MKTTLLSERDYVLNKNEIYFIEPFSKHKYMMFNNTSDPVPCIKYDDKTVWSKENSFYDKEGTLGIIASTTNLEGVKQLDRKYFVNKEDVKMLAHIHACDTYVYPKNKDGERVTMPAGQTTPPNFNKHCKAVEPHFIAGYNANKGEFTLEQLKTAWAYGVEASGTFEDVLKIIRPLSLPTSIEVDSEYNVIKVNW